jgi:hypothetical protein
VFSAAPGEPREPRDYRARPGVRAAGLAPRHPTKEPRQGRAGRRRTPGPRFARPRISPPHHPGHKRTSRAAASPRPRCPQGPGCSSRARGREPRARLRADQRQAMPANHCPRYIPPALFPLVRLAVSAAKGCKTLRAQGPVRGGSRDSPAGAENGPGKGHLVRRRADVHAGIVEDEVRDGHELAVEKEARAGVRKIAPADKAVADRTCPQALVEPSERVLGFGQRAPEGPRQGLVQGFVGEAPGHARSAVTSIAAPGTRRGASAPEVSRSREV